MKKRLLFVCLGNICRSPSAEAVMNGYIKANQLGDKFECDSAGTGGWHAGDKADERMRRHALRRNYNLTSIARKFDAKIDFDKFDLIFGMDQQNVNDLKVLARNEADLKKIKSITTYCSHYSNYSSVPDPYYGGDDGFELVLDILEDACKGLLNNLT
ncbi:low molecular weight protein-tyrosine-phosphatase [Labilibaculum sp. K2S]|uniref:low molecular weight protein-tyrosine-phosphatase n=1 Tax=Labilibaculum sp. K2S TaxID=3056386 RepID=UPI0025A4C6CC|nr:low molecular weight protein-tyrosine-phosphatase [Labilibaculum sp. K2S]MDM8158726.1 low molecular weight protein-tyrosine-phosphatase [Labilibaculum sp. K2S]